MRFLTVWVCLTFVLILSSVLALARAASEVISAPTSTTSELSRILIQSSRVACQEDEPCLLPSLIQLEDPSAPSSSLYTVLLHISHGFLTLSSLEHLHLAEGDPSLAQSSDEGNLYFTGTLSNVNAAMEAMVYESVLDWSEHGR